MLFKQTRLLIIILTIAVVAMVTPQGLGAIDAQNIINESLQDTAQKGDIDTATSLPTFVGRFINAIFGLIGVIFLGITLIGGLLWMMAGGNEEKVMTGKKFIIGGIEGIIITFLSYAMVYLVLSALQYATP